MMKQLATYFTFLLFGLGHLQASEWEGVLSELMGRYVKADGVDYEGWSNSKEDAAALKQVAKAIGESEEPSGERDENLVWYLNAYNALILHQVIEKYPIDSVGKNMVSLGLFFRSKSLVVAGEKMSFHHLENDIIRDEFSEPRIHFALNCASASCPPLMAKVFVAETLDADLDLLTRAYVESNPLGFQERDGEIYLSKIFDWYAEDFGGSEGIVDYINKFRSQPIPDGVQVKYQDYDWGLNRAE